MTTPKVYLAGGDNFGWALDEDLRLVEQALSGTVDFTNDITTADVVHAAWWEPFALLPDEQLAGKRLICHIPGEPARYLKVPAHRHAIPKVSRWVARSKESMEQCQQLGFNVRHIPYVVDTTLFHPIATTESVIQQVIDRWQLPVDKYIIGNFHRDSEGHDLIQPKLVKGPDIFAEMMRVLVEQGYPVHVLLAGPRRHWIRRQLEAYNVPYTYAGEVIERDDLNDNLLTREQLNELYAICDLYVVSSRSEGGPQSIMESAAAKCKIISTRVGLANDILEEASIFDDVVEGVEIIRRDIDDKWLDATIEAQYQRVIAAHTPETTKSLFIALYDNWQNITPYHPSQKKPPKITFRRRLRRFSKRFRPGISIGLWHTFFKPPYGGGNQFLLALRKALKQRDIHIVENKLSPFTDAYLLNSIHFDVEKFRAMHRTQQLSIVHRIDGPIFLIRGFDKEKDDLAFELNQELADSTVLQSLWSYQRILEMGYRPVKPVIVHNAVDPDIFHARGRVSFSPERKIRIVSSSWSDNPRKGGPLYKWIDQNLDWDRYEYTFVGRASETFENIKLVDPVPSEDLADILRQHDVYITASERDPCSNALIEALQCGLPALYRNDGGHPELVQYGGLPFEGEQDVLQQLDKLVTNYQMFQQLIMTNSLDNVAMTYFSLLQDAARSNA